jgi:hypothetical protein
MNLIAREKSAHFYSWDHDNNCARAFYEVPRADGLGMRPATLRDARKHNLLWSVTRVCNCVAKPGLQSWLQEQAIMAALTLPRLPDEPLDAFARRVVEDFEQQGSAARDFGSKLHKQIEQDLAGELDVPDILCAEHLRVVREWLNENCEDIHASEIIVGDPALGVAGKLDLDCTIKHFGRCIPDIKTQRVKDGKPIFYPEWPLQLAVYRHCRQRELFESWPHARPPMRLLSLVIDSNPNDPKVYPHWWTDEVDYLALFTGLLNWICFESNYDPRTINPKEQ